MSRKLVEAPFFPGIDHGRKSGYVTVISDVGIMCDR